MFCKKPLLLSSLTVLLACSGLLGGIAQEASGPCGQELADSFMFTKNSDWYNKAHFENWMAENKAQNTLIQNRSVITIPVIVHVIHNGEAVGSSTNIPYEQVISQIEVLNEDFRKLPGTRGFNQHQDGALMDIEFCPALLDQNGSLLAEPGVNRIQGFRNGWTISQIETELKPKTYWNPNRYFNVWVLDLKETGRNDVVGYSQYPIASTIADLEHYEAATQTDGIVIHYRVFGSAEKGSFPVLKSSFNLGRVATHETGHWLGLRHIWGEGGCDSDDYCDDTPNASQPHYTCAAVVSCGSQDMIENYMDYTPDACMNVFTNDQKARIMTVLLNSPMRKELMESTACTMPLVMKLEGSEFEIYPNPFTDLLKIQIISPEETEASDLCEVILFNAIGQKFLMDKVLINEKKEIDLSNLQSGTYFLRFANKSFSKTARAIKI